MRYTKTTATGAFLDKKTLVNGQKAKLVSECVPVERDFEGKPQTQHIAKVQVEGVSESKNTALNIPTRNGLIEAFGEDSKEWMGHPLTVYTEKTTIGGKRVIVLYLLPEGFEVGEDEGGYVVVKRIGTAKSVEGNDPLESEFDPAQIPF
jgi:hypothetical protein